jgi:hypothetical protein
MAKTIVVQPASLADVTATFADWEGFIGGIQPLLPPVPVAQSTPEHVGSMFQTASLSGSQSSGISLTTVLLLGAIGYVAWHFLE